MEINAFKDKWLKIKGSKNRNRLLEFEKFITNRSFEHVTTGGYKKVFISKNHDFVIKISKTGTGMSFPKNPIVRLHCLMPIWNDKNVMFQPKAITSKQAQQTALRKLIKIFKAYSLLQYVEARDFDVINCAMYNNTPVILDLSYYSGYEIQNNAY